MSSRTRSRNAFASQTTGILTVGGTSVDLVTASGLVGPLYGVFAPNDVTKREFVRVTTVNTNTLSAITRNLDGSAAGAPFEHAAGTEFRMVPVHHHLDDIFDDIEALEAVDTAHVPNADAHHAEDHAARHASAGADALGADSVTSVQLADDSVTQAQLADDSVGQAQVIDGLVAIPDMVTAFDFDIANESVPASFGVIMDASITIPAGWNSWSYMIWWQFDVVLDTVSASNWTIGIRVPPHEQFGLHDIGSSIGSQWPLMYMGRGSGTGTGVQAIGEVSGSASLCTARLVKGSYQAIALRLS